jgi:transaldolase
VLTWTRRTSTVSIQENIADSSRYHDSDPILDLYPRAQQYYKQHGIPTKVKSCAFMTTDEIISMAGVDAMTLPAEVLESLSSMTDLPERLEARSVFQNTFQPSSISSRPLSYINDKTKFNRAYATNGRGKAKTEDVSGILPS